MQRKGLNYRALLQGGNMRDIRSLSDYVNSITGVMVNMTRTAYAKVSFITCNYKPVKIVIEPKLYARKYEYVIDVFIRRIMTF